MTLQSDLLLTGFYLTLTSVSFIISIYHCRGRYRILLTLLSSSLFQRSVALVERVRFQGKPSATQLVASSIELQPFDTCDLWDCRWGRINSRDL